MNWHALTGPFNVTWHALISNRMHPNGTDGSLTSVWPLRPAVQRSRIRACECRCWMKVSAFTFHVRSTSFLTLAIPPFISYRAREVELRLVYACWREWQTDREGRKKTERERERETERERERKREGERERERERERETSVSACFQLPRECHCRQHRRISEITLHHPDASVEPLTSLNHRLRGWVHFWVWIPSNPNDFEPPLKLAAQKDWKIVIDGTGWGVFRYWCPGGAAQGHLTGELRDEIQTLICHHHRRLSLLTQPTPLLLVLLGFHPSFTKPTSTTVIPAKCFPTHLRGDGWRVLWFHLSRSVSQCQPDLQVIHLVFKHFHQRHIQEPLSHLKCFVTATFGDRRAFFFYHATFTGLKQKLAARSSKGQRVISEPRVHRQTVGEQTHSCTVL